MPAANVDKLDLFKLHKAEYTSPKKPKIIETQPARYLAVDGQGEPGGDIFQERIGGLFGVAYTAKFQSKFAGKDYVVCKLEALWGVGGQTKEDMDRLPPSEWKWRMLMRIPDFIGEKQLEEAKTMLREKGKEGDFDAVHIEEIDEGKCVQMLHVGPYEEEPRTVEVMQAFVAEEGLTTHRWHHEIYISDPRRVPPERLKTILRQPVRKA